MLIIGALAAIISIKLAVAHTAYAWITERNVTCCSTTPSPSLSGTMESIPVPVNAEMQSVTPQHTESSPAGTLTADQTPTGFYV